MARDMRFGSDLIVDWLSQAGIRHVALNPGATLRGLHDSLVRHPGLRPILALHEEIAVGIAHGYGKAAGEPMAVLTHDLVGLQHASMAIFNAWVDRVPMLVLGGSGPRDEEDRRPWLDWIHTGLPQGSLVREFVAWDAEPSTLTGLHQALQRGLRRTSSEPCGPVYVSVDTGLQERPIGDLELPPLAVTVADRPAAGQAVVDEIAGLLAAAQRPVVVVDRPVRGLAGPLLELVELLTAAVVDLGGGCNVPTTHWADQSLARRETLAEADLVLALEVRDPVWAVTETDTGTRATESLLADGTPVVVVGLSELRHRGFLVPEALLPGARLVTADAGLFTGQLLATVQAGPSPPARAARRAALDQRHRTGRGSALAQARAAAQVAPVAPAHLALALWEAIAEEPWQLANGLLGGWPRRLWDIDAPDQYLGRSGGEGLGYGLPASIGAALAGLDSDRLVVDLQADGDLLYTASALWTAAHDEIPLLVVVHNNRSYGKDELHQREMAALRQRSDGVVPIGIALRGPDIDFAALARAHGVEGIGPVEQPDQVREVLRKAATTVRRERRPVLVDVICGS